MGYISKRDLKLVTFMNRKYKSYNVFFNYFDDYILFLYETIAQMRDDVYYALLEQDMMEYSNMQTGSPRYDKYDNYDEVDE